MRNGATEYIVGGYWIAGVALSYITLVYLHCDVEFLLLALHAKIENLSIFVSGKDHIGTQQVDLKDVRKLLSRLYEAGTVIEKWLGSYGDGAVSSHLLTSKLAY